MPRESSSLQRQRHLSLHHSGRGSFGSISSMAEGSDLWILLGQYRVSSRKLGIFLPIQRCSSICSVFRISIWRVGTRAQKSLASQGRWDVSSESRSFAGITATSSLMLCLLRSSISTTCVGFHPCAKCYQYMFAGCSRWVNIASSRLTAN